MFVDRCCLVDVEGEVLCKYKLNERDLAKLRDAIEDLYYFEFVIGKFVSVLTYFLRHYVSVLYILIQY